MRTVKASVGAVLLSILVQACGDDEGEGGGSCSVRDTDAGVQISCPDGTNTTIPRTSSTLPDGGTVVSCHIERDAANIDRMSAHPQVGAAFDDDSLHAVACQPPSQCRACDPSPRDQNSHARTVSAEHLEVKRAAIDTVRCAK